LVTPSLSSGGCGRPGADFWAAAKAEIQQEPGLSVNAACKRIGPQLGILPDTLRGWCKQADLDDGLASGVTTAESEELKRLRRENAEPRRANEILKTTSAFFRRRSSTAISADRGLHRPAQAPLRGRADLCRPAR
jgi:transposase-like protein